MVVLLIEFDFELYAEFAQAVLGYVPRLRRWADSDKYHVDHALLMRDPRQDSIVIQTLTHPSPVTVSATILHELTHCVQNQRLGGWRKFEEAYNAGLVPYFGEPITVMDTYNYFHPVNIAYWKNPYEAEAVEAMFLGRIIPFARLAEPQRNPYGGEYT